jgi:glycosyltransferase involved in cell wall biosynthesis
VSVVIPAYNAEETIDECLRAVLNQEDYRVGEDYEIIVVNDGSTDRTAEIVSGYSPIRLVNLETNSGRIVARRTGVEAAHHETVLLIDARIVASPNVLKTFESIGYTPLMTGDCGHDKDRSKYDTLLYLLRRIYYRPYFPQSEYGTEMWITAENFAKAPKGMGCVFIDKGLFLDALPKRQDKTVNDDTRIFERIAIEKGIKILRSTDLKVEYRQRLESGKFCKWLFGRGVLFADFWLFRRPLYLLALLFSYILAVSSVTAIFFAPVLFGIVAATLVLGYLAVAIAISEERSDWVPVASSLYQAILLFWAGVTWGMFLKAKSLFRTPEKEK